MNELRRDPITGRWIIVCLDKIPNLEDLKALPQEKKDKECPFCLGHERMTPPEITAHRKLGPSNSSGWTVRVVPNKYPALRIEGELHKEGIGLFDLMNGVGAHEVIIETSDHFRDIHDLNKLEMEEVIWTYLARSMDLKQDKRLKYILIFKNYGIAAGASLSHPHSQLISLPIVPKRVKEELEGATRYFEYRGRCVFCDMIREETEEGDRIVYQDDKFIAFCPYVSRFPYEIWILPKKHQPDFASTERDAVPNLARALKTSLIKIKGLLNDPPFNFIIHTSPINGYERDDYHWHIEIMPKLSKVAGFEWGSGFYINPVPPDIAASGLASIKTEES